MENAMNSVFLEQEVQLKGVQTTILYENAPFGALSPDLIVVWLKAPLHTPERTRTRCES